MCQEQSNLVEPASATHFVKLTQAHTSFFHIIHVKICILFAREKHAVLQTQVARCTEGRTGRDKVTLKSQ